MAEEIIEPKKEKKKKPKSKARKIIEWVLTGLFVALFGFVSVIQIIGTTTKSKNNGVPNYNGYQVLVILTDSMEPQYKVNGAVIVKKVDPSQITIGDNATFMYDVNGTYMPMTHQISDIQAPTAEDPHWHFEAHGINTHSTQCEVQGEPGDCTYQRQYFTEEALMGKVVGYSMFIGVVFNFMITPWGLLLLLLLPALYLIITSVIDLVKAAKLEEEEEANQPASEENKGALSRLSDEDIKRLKEEMLSEMMENRNKEKK